VLDNVRLGHDARSPDVDSDEAAREILDALQLGRLAATVAGRLVNLERRLVGLARCLVTRPRVLLLDEPGAGLVTHEKAQLARVVKAVATERAETTVLIEHDMDFVAETCPSVAVLNFGKLLTAGPTSDVLDDARVRAAYLGEEY